MTSKEKIKFRTTKEWKIFRTNMLLFAECTCDLCGTQYKGKRTKMLQVHHLEPENYTALFPDKFKVVCSSCHDLIERFSIKKSWGVYEEKWKALLEPFMAKENTDEKRGL
jgi:predicted HNH restriction endonuclease